MLDEKDPELLNTKTEVKKTLSDATTSYFLKNSYLAGKESKSYKLRLWMDENTPTDDKYMNKTFASKLVVVSTTYEKEIDKTPPVANFTTTAVNGGYLVDARTSTDDSSGISTYYYSKDGVNWVSSKEDNYVLKDDVVLTSGKATDVITSIAESKVYDIYVKVEDNFENMSEVVKKNVKQSELVYDETIDNNLRYVGASPNNYVMFNNELWRIIGVMNHVIDADGNQETRLKLVKNESIGSFAWDSSSSSTNEGKGINEWSQADIMKLLNPGYETETVGGSLYWNRGSGTCYSEKNLATKACDFTSIGLTEEAKQLIGEAIWYTGKLEHIKNMTASQSYVLERGNAVSCTNCSDNVTRKNIWKGYVGLIYPSDYIFSMSDATCRSKSIYDAGERNFGTCKYNTWISASWDFTINPYCNGLFETTAIATNSDAGYHRVSEPDAIFPHLYLKSNVHIVSGDGSSSSPFQLELK